MLPAESLFILSHKQRTKKAECPTHVPFRDSHRAFRQKLPVKAALAYTVLNRQHSKAFPGFDRSHAPRLWNASIVMQKLNIIQCWRRLAGIALIALATFSTQAVDPYFYAVKTTTTVSASPARISFAWTADASATGVTIQRKAIGATSWTTVATLAGSATSWSDSNVAVGDAYEYAFNIPCSGYTATGYVYAGINAPMTESRGKVLLVVDNTYASQLASELSRLQQDLAGDGWTVVRRDVSRTDSVVSVKNVIKSEYNNGGLRTVFLFGHVPVPYSGDLNPDGHPDHKGAWPADVYYADMDGSWTDSSVSDTSAAKSWNYNVPGDGKFDQSEIPSDLELEVGRVDLANMTCYSNKTPSRSELDLLRQYLNKDHNFRLGLMNVARRGAVCDNFGVPYGEAFAAAGWRLSSEFFGANATAIPGNTFFSNLTQNGYLFAYACGGGSFYTCAGIGSSDDFAINDTKAVFTLMLGSYFADWDNESNFMRAAIGGTTYTLTTGWSGRPEWWLHHMGLGETIGYGTKLTQNNRQGGIYSPQYMGTRQVHIALHGDPTLRLHPVLPPSAINGTTTGSTVTLTWAPSADSSIQGYHVYRATSANGPYTRLTSSLTGSLTYVDAAAPAGAVYMVRAVKLESSGSGTYFNPSQGVFYTSGSTGGGGGGTTSPVAPSNLTVTASGASQLNVRWSDNSSDETNFKIERKTGAAGTYATISTTAANAVSFTDSSLAQGTQYFYRLSAVNAGGASATVEASGTTAAGSPVTASATFVNTDAATSGSWKGVYGADGASVMGDASTLPGYVQVTPSGNSAWTWNYSTTDTRAPQKISGTDRIASAWYLDGSFAVDLNFTDGQAHRVALYFLDWDLSGRSQTVQILDAGSGSVLSAQTINDFGNGKYLIWDLKGAVRVKLTKTSGFNAVLNGLFFAPAAATGGAGGIQHTSDGTLSGQNWSLQITGSVGQKFKVYSSADLTNWTDRGTVTLTGTTYNFTDAASAGMTFYRAVPQ